MKFFLRRLLLSGGWRSPVGLVVLALSFGVRCVAAEAPIIRSIEINGTNAIIRVSIPKGIRRVVLESKARADSGPWTSRELQWPDGVEGEHTFIVPATDHLELVRVNATDTTRMPLSAKFYGGAKNFGAIRQTANTDAIRNPGAFPPGENATDMDGPITANPGPSAPRAVIESDIWQLKGDTLYFFNANRGLQVIDVANPDAPVLKGTLPLAAAGEQMYVLPTGGNGLEFVALLAADGCDGRQSQIVIVEVNGADLKEVARIPVVGAIQESRIVGTALYLAGRYYAQITPQTTDASGKVTPAQWGMLTTIQSFDLANPRVPVTHPAVTLEVYPNAIQATENYLMVATTGSQYSEDARNTVTNAIHLFDIRDPSGIAHSVGSVATEGRVQDKFKMQIRDGYLTAVSVRDALWTGGSVRPASVWVETFLLAQLGQARGKVKLIEGESLHATRYDGDRLYVVTFRQIDPLWIIDLSRPETPVVLSELEVPGFSTYIHPMGDRLLTMGQERGAAVSLFDVSDVRKPKLLTRVKLGDWSWSEANSDEKAFKVLPEAGLVLVPWSGWKASVTGDGGKYFTGMQLVDLSRDSLKLRGNITQSFQARRATLHRDRILSLSGSELVSVDAADRDHLQLKARLDLAPQVDRVWVAGDYLINWVSGNSDSQGNWTTHLKVSRKESPEKFIADSMLSSVYLQHADQRAGQLRLLVRERDTYTNRALAFTNTYITPVVGKITYRSQSYIQTNWFSQQAKDQWNEVTVTDIRGQPPVFAGFKTNIQVIQLPPLPDGSGPQMQTNTTVEAVWEPQPDNVVTEQVALRTWELHGPVVTAENAVADYWERSNSTVTTNVVVGSNHVQRVIPGATRLIVLDLAALPQLDLRTLELPARHLAGAQFSETGVRLLERGPDDITYENPVQEQVIHLETWSPVSYSWSTNSWTKTDLLPKSHVLQKKMVVDWVTPTGVYFKTNIFILQVPPIPGEVGEPPWITNIVVRKESVTGQPVQLTNTYSYAASSGSASEFPVTTIQVSMFGSQEYHPVVFRAMLPTLQSTVIPGEGRLTSIRLPASGALEVESSITFTWDAQVSTFGVYRPKSPRSGIEAWISAETGHYIGRPWVDFRGGLGAPPRLSDDVFVGDVISPWGWNPFWYGNPNLALLIFDVSRQGDPRFGGLVKLEGTADRSGNFSEPYAGENRLFASSRTTTYIPPSVQYLTRTNANGTTYQEWQPGTYEHRHQLHVVEFGSDTVMPQIKTPVDFPGNLKGVSHGGALLYAERGMEEGTYEWGWLGSWEGDGGLSGMNPGDSTKPMLDALAYDGQSASWVTSLAIPRGPNSTPVYSLRSDGTVWLAAPAGTNNTPATLEVWAVSTDAAFARYAVLPMGGINAASIHTVADVVAVGLVDGNVQFLKDVAPRTLAPLRHWRRSCNFWTDWSTTAGDSSVGLWIPRGYLGLWHVDLKP